MGNDQEIDDVEVEDEVVVDEVETDDVEVKLDEDGNPVEAADEERVVEAWQETEENEDDELPDVPVGKHIAMKSKLKGRIKERDSELDALRKKIEALESSGATSTVDLPPRPKAEDFDTDELHEAALEEWEDKRLEIKLAAKSAETQSAAASERVRAATEKAVDEHYDRSAKLVESSGIKAEYFKEADNTVREAVEALLPKQGNAVTDHIISLLGEGSEKVMYFIGRNKAARLEFQSLLSEDRTGMKAMVFLGQQKERLTNPKKPTSKAPKPASDVNGDVAPSQKGSAMKKKYDAAHGAGKTQAAYNIKKQARAAKIDVSSW